MYSAIYFPALSQEEEDPSRSGFATEQEAEEYVFSQMCSQCQEERRLALDKKYDPNLSEYPSCFFEWGIGLTDEIESSQCMGDVRNACGWKRIDPKNDAL